MGERGLLISTVDPAGPAAAAGLAAGDRILRMQGETVRDLIDFMFFAEDSVIRVIAERNGQHVEATIRGAEETGAGIELAADQMRPAVCVNRCPFCFVDQMPRGFRPSLYVKDDDWRYSFLYGSYVTLTNLTEHDYARIRSRRISPLYVSVHATEDAVRCQMLGTPKAKGVLRSLERLADGGTSFHAQCVLIEGLNDGRILEQTVRDLAALHPRALSVALVPVGLTSSRKGLAQLSPFSPDAAAAVVDMTEQLQAEFAPVLGTRFVFAADELYLRAGRRIPDPAQYEDFGQLENGIGLAAAFRADAETAADEGGRARPEAFVLVTGLGIASEARELAGRLRRRLGLDLAVRGVRNKTFGTNVDVTGLLTGRDVVLELAGRTEGRTVLLPDVMFRDGNGVTLDSMSASDISRGIGAPCEIVPSEGGAFVRALLEPEGKR